MTTPHNLDELADKREVGWPIILIATVWCWYIVWAGTVPPLFFDSRLLHVAITVFFPISVSFRLWRSRASLTRGEAEG